MCVCLCLYTMASGPAQREQYILLYLCFRSTTYSFLILYLSLFENASVTHSLRRQDAISNDPFPCAVNQYITTVVWLYILYTHTVRVYVPVRSYYYCIFRLVDERPRQEKLKSRLSQKPQQQQNIFICVWDTVGFHFEYYIR